MKKILAFVLALTMLLSVCMLAGCGEKADPTQGNKPTQGADPKPTQGNQPAAPVGNFAVPEEGYDGSAVEIKFYNTMGASLLDVLKEYIPEFNKMYPNITVAVDSIGGYDDVRDQIKTEITVGNQPNLAYCYPDHVAMYNLAQATVILDDLIDSKIEVKRADGTTEILGLTDEQKADFIEGYYNEGKQFGDGLMYTMPMSKSTEVLYYNKTFFEANGLTVPKTWDEMEELCAKIKAIDPTSIPLGYDSESNWFITMCEQYGSPYTSASGDHFLFDNDTNKAFVKRFHEWYQKGYLTTQTIFGAYTSELFKASTGTHSYMSIGSSAGATHQRPEKGADGNYPFEVGITTIPQVDAAKAKVISQGPSLCIFNSKNISDQQVVASWLFVKFLTTNVEFQAAFGAASGYVPVLKSVSDETLAEYEKNDKGEFVLEDGKKKPINAVAHYVEFIDGADGGEFIAALSAKVCLEQADAYYTSPAFNGSSEARDQVGNLLTAALTYTGNDFDSYLDELFMDAIDECEYNS